MRLRDVAQRLRSRQGAQWIAGSQSPVRPAPVSDPGHAAGWAGQASEVSIPALLQMKDPPWRGQKAPGYRETEADRTEVGSGQFSSRMPLGTWFPRIRWRGMGWAPSRVTAVPAQDGWLC